MQFNDSENRIPDFTALITWYQTCKMEHPLYRQPLLAFWWEIKPLDTEKEWDGGIARHEAGVVASQHIEQVNEQAQFAFAQYGQGPKFTFIFVGLWFTLMKYEISPISPPVKRRRYVKDGQPPKYGRKVRRQKFDHKDSGMSNQVNQPSGSRQTLSGNSGDLSSDDDLLGAPHPSVIYHNQPVLRFDRQGFHPLFLKALDEVMSLYKGIISFQPSFFNVPPGDHQVSPSSKASTSCVRAFFHIRSSPYILQIATSNFEVAMVEKLDLRKATVKEDLKDDPDSLPSPPDKGSPYVPRTRLLGKELGAPRMTRAVSRAALNAPETNHSSSRRPDPPSPSPAPRSNPNLKGKGKRNPQDRDD
ncbi:hypothetical protein EW146_g9516 [Bondarzewia mesenterica]|uniref:Uncharacterized protein n=1 Tax=Bondarzewia mesenterica TaxID=1095465 RepID=A0A4S4L5S6_9AGAM|nr:hypothetical protein EW146_g9516 [Bondarzewia mesenterica]